MFMIYPHGSACVSSHTVKKRVLALEIFPDNKNSSLSLEDFVDQNFFVCGAAL